MKGWGLLVESVETADISSTVKAAAPEAVGVKVAVGGTGVLVWVKV
jgi:hypothetical protein